MRWWLILNGFLALTAQTPYEWPLGKGFPRPSVPAANPMSAAKVELGRHLFYDERMSVNGKQACASCHRQDLAFTDGKPRGEGATGERHSRGSMSLVNVAYAPSLTWANPVLTALEEQALVPIQGFDPIELGLRQGEETNRFLSLVRQDALYRRLFAAAFPDDRDRFTLDNVTKAIAAFERSIVSTRSPYDRYRYGGDRDAISESAKRGEILFFSSQKAGCFQCHGGWNFSGPIRFEGGPQPEAVFHNTGLYNLEGYAAKNTGLHQHSGRQEDVGKFRTPTLRNVELTGPYMHDGSIATLEEVIDHYAAGGRAAGNPNKSSILRGFQLSAQEKQDLIEFLRSLTDRELLRDPRWSNPWPQTGRSSGK
jgi:cytochrome c peroxidase